jgi:hypothetical protein
LSAAFLLVEVGPPVSNGYAGIKVDLNASLKHRILRDSPIIFMVIYE